MANLKEVKNRIASVTSTQQITSAMKMVAAAKLKRATDKMIQMRPYAQKLASILQNVTAGLDEGSENAYSEEREIENVLLVVVTSDRGLCGGFNNNIFKATLALIKEKYSYEEKHNGVFIMPIGKKAYEYFRKRNYQLVDDHYGMFHDLSFDNSRKASKQVMDAFVKGTYDKVEIVYNEFKNVATQILRVEQFLPIDTSETDVEEKIEALQDLREFIFQPSKEFVINELVPKSLKNSVL